MAVTSEHIPDRGDVVWISTNLEPGYEQTERRLAVVLSPAAYNGMVGLALFCPITERIKGYPFEVIIPVGAGVTGVILADQVKSLDWRARRIEIICKLPKVTVAEVLQKLGTLCTD